MYSILIDYTWKILYSDLEVMKLKDICIMYYSKTDPWTQKCWNVSLHIGFDSRKVYKFTCNF